MIAAEPLLLDDRRLLLSAGSKSIPVYGYIYDVYSGNLVEVAEATEAGRPSQSNAKSYPIPVPTWIGQCPHLSVC
jgi:hypothetical protein